jgi:hypothetical protein
MSDLRDVIEREGGTVESVSSLNSRLILRSPFPSRFPTNGPLAGPRPVLLRLRCRYPDDCGSWFVRAEVTGEIEWTWMSDSGSGLPVERDDASVKNGIIVLPLLVGALLYLALVALAFAVVLYFFGKRR